MFYKFCYDGIERELPVYGVGGGVKIAYLDTLSDIGLVNALSRNMANLVAEGKDFLKAESVVLLTAASKGIPFAYAVANALLSRFPDKKIFLAVARKEDKKFFGKTVSVSKTSITSQEGGDKLVLTEQDAKKLDGAAVVVIDDMCSTGASVNALEKLAISCNARVIDKVVAVCEGDEGKRSDGVKFVATLPLIK